jgi:hypothetical protein
MSPIWGQKRMTILSNNYEAHLAKIFADAHSGDSRAPCPFCSSGEHRSKGKTLGITKAADGRVVWHCFRCAAAGVHTPERSHPHTTREPRPLVQVDRPHHDGLSHWAMALWRSTQPITSADTAGKYLLNRCCALPPLHSHLRWHPSLKHPSGYQGAALVALLTHAVTTKPMSLHRTWVQANGKKADLDPPRLLLGGHTKAGTVCRLWPDDEVTMGLGIAEGIETALSLAHGYTPVWAAIDAGNLSQLPYLHGIENLLIARDRDPAGERAATACAARWDPAGATVLITQQATNDLNDFAQGSAA